MIRHDQPLVLKGRAGDVELVRLKTGSARICASSMRDALYGLGRFHMEDRQIQMNLMRLTAQGRLSQYISPRPGLREVDIYVRKLLLAPDLDDQVNAINKASRNLLEAYVSGINDFLNAKGRRFELKLSGMELPPWTVRDILALTKAIAGMTLFDFQGKMIKFIVQMIQLGVDEVRLKELFPQIREKIDIELLGKVKLSEEPSGNAMNFISLLAGFRGASNFVVSGDRSVTGNPILAGDLLGNVNRLPSMWYDVAIKIPGNTISGFTIPGIPAVLMGRTEHISYAPAYSYGDMMNYRIEECAGGKFRRGNRWLPFDVHREGIDFKKGDEEIVEIYENEHGILEGNPFDDGFHLIRSWSAQRECGAIDLETALRLMEAKTTREAMRLCRNIETMPLSFLIADISGNIAKQMTGKILKRPKTQSGLIPLPAWDRRYNSTGFWEAARLPWEYNPERGYLLQNENSGDLLDKAPCPNLCPTVYRQDRIESVIRGRKKLDAEVVKDIQYDLYSLQGFEIISHVEEFIPHNSLGVKLQTWDYRYGPDSEGAVVFENLYRSMLEIILGEYGSHSVDLHALILGNDLFRDHCGIFDRVLLSEKSSWFRKASGRDLKKIAMDRALAMAVKPYGKWLSARLGNIFFRGRLASLLGVQGRRFPLFGSRATIQQGRLLRQGGEEVAVGSVARMIADMGEEGVFLNSPGGTSDRPLSKLYKNNMEAWFRGCYRKVP